MKVAVIGSDGQLGSDVVAAFAEQGDEVSSLTHANIELMEPDSVSTCLKEVKPDLIVNTAAMHHVERCEQEPEKAFAINAMGSRNLAFVARELDAVLMHVSTDYVFDGEKRMPYEEQDAPRPLNVYGNTKLAGEYFVRSTHDKHFVLRTSGLYGKSPCRGKGGLNFVDLMLKLGKERGKVHVVNSEEVTPTSTAELVRQMVLLSRTRDYGLFHATAEGSCTWYDFAREIFSIARLPAQVEIANPQEFPAKVPRPTYSVLKNAALKAHGINCFGSWQEGLRRYLLESPSVPVRLIPEESHLSDRHLSAR
ncbi:dTDP-4-dehydrorhamnose reductase [Silvibacterium bohemicum]|uniref:dTDP-4-dehydrorhamnose reductase n=1 Tax=Silvibacterium bohemicum TaxID=1577686 RepID=A0A841JR33_9BACT|nr:dTDP-4-dehydrorhamnose reductase [Silvibacterium bohemicum]MBB6142875.1 dTDP-4-dehydrorhamnose reductase [Silvibacterium bohemicum]